jgi:predicted SprT family Zn-dependent metalloprotease
LCQAIVRYSMKFGPTREQFAAYEKMFGFFNTRLFRSELPACLLNFSRRRRSNGFFAPQRWENGREVRHEISINPSTLKNREPIQVASTLVHEMVHLWQAEYGQPSRAGYHNREWAMKMEEVGLVPSTTGDAKGRKVGQRMTHYVADGGPFERAFQAMPAEFLLPWACEEPGITHAKLAKNKVKYSCPGCDVNVWGRPGLSISCDECRKPFVALEAVDRPPGFTMLRVVMARRTQHK